MFRSSLLLTLLLSAIPAHADQVYRWRDASGTVHYSDLAPPADAHDAQRKRVGERAPDRTLPYAVRAAMRDFPVTLYVAAGCGSGCNQAGSYLSGRGTPYTEIDALDGDNAQALSALTGGRREVPVLVVGKTVLRGWDEANWARTLDAAGYPRAPLPKGMVARRVPPKAPVADKVVDAGPGLPAEVSPQDGSVPDVPEATPE